ncbi:MAG: hypothetical protein P4L31_00440 [Candidatus Babeliales bacterium]|nr:hypothetical protein [Candidatus Babeliales bacterium]
MTLYSIILSITIGTLIGVAYAVSFLLNKTRMLFSINDEMHHPSLKNKITKLVFSITRLTILAMVWIYTMRLPSVSFALVIFSFFISFWAVIITKKSKLSE